MHKRFATSVPGIIPDMARSAGLGYNIVTTVKI